jgi:hypothetical protein
MRGVKMKSDPWVQMRVIESEARMEIIELLFEYQIISLSEMKTKLMEIYSHKITLPGLLRHIHELEKVGIIRQDSGFFLPKPDTRKRVYIIQGKDRVKEILGSLTKLKTKLTAGMVFSELSECARYLLSREPILQPNEREMLERMIEKCGSEDIFCHLTDDEKKKLKLYKLMLSNAPKV